MEPRAFTRSILCFGLLASTPALSNGLDCGCYDGTYPGESNKPYFVIDARSGDKIEGGDRFDQRDTVNIVLDNQNPYLFKYKLTHKSENIESQIIRDALEAIVNLKGTGTTDEIEDIKGKNDKTLDTTMTCTAEAVLMLVKTKLEAADSLVTSTQLSSKGLFNSKADCQQLCTATQAQETSFKGTQFKTEFITASDGIEASKTALLEWKAEKSDSCSKSPADQEKVKQKIDKALVVAASQLADLGKLIAAVDATAKAESPFHDRKPISASSESRKHTVSVERTSVEKGDTDKWSYEFETGRSRFSYSVGMGVSFIKQQSYAVGNTNVGESGDSPSKVVKLTDHSDESVGIVGQLNGELWSNQHLSFLWSLGASLTSSPDDLQFGLYTGPSFGFIDNRLIFTLAYHAIKVDKPDSGFEEGEILPPDFSGDVPISSETETGALFSITWRFE